MKAYKISKPNVQISKSSPGWPVQAVKALSPPVMVEAQGFWE